jgi:hypothetical protein
MIFSVVCLSQINYGLAQISTLKKNEFNATQLIVNGKPFLMTAGEVNNPTGAKGDFDTPEQHIGSFQIDRPWEPCMTIAHQWAWKPNDDGKLLQPINTILELQYSGNVMNIKPMDVKLQ